MFGELTDSNWANRPHRGWTALASFSLQALAVCTLFLLPMIYTEGFHLPLTARMVLPLPPPGPAAPSQQARQTAQANSNLSSHGEVIAPPVVPRGVAPIEEEIAPPPADLSGAWVPGGTGDSRLPNSVLGSLGNEIAPSLPPPPPVVAHKPPISHMMEGNLIYRIQPEYPVLARQAHVQGAVLLRAVISREGTIENLQVLSGHPLLVKAAIDALKKLRTKDEIARLRGVSL